MARPIGCAKISNYAHFRGRPNCNPAVRNGVVLGVLYLHHAHVAEWCRTQLEGQGQGRSVGGEITFRWKCVSFNPKRPNWTGNKHPLCTPPQLHVTTVTPSL